MFQYLLDLKEPDTAAQALGKAFCETIAHNFRQKNESWRDLPIVECLEFFRRALGEHLQKVALQKGEHPMALLELGEMMVVKYVAEADSACGGGIEGSGLLAGESRRIR
jgi:hypothetical protein